MTSLRFAGMACSDMVSIRIFGRCIMVVGWSVPDGWIRIHGVRRKSSVRWSTASVQRALLCRQYVTTSRSLIEKNKQAGLVKFQGLRLEIQSLSALKLRLNLDLHQLKARRFQLLKKRLGLDGDTAAATGAGTLVAAVGQVVVHPSVVVLPLHLPSIPLQSPASPRTPSGQ